MVCSQLANGQLDGLWGYQPLFQQSNWSGNIFIKWMISVSSLFVIAFMDNKLSVRCHPSGLGGSKGPS